MGGSKRALEVKLWREGDELRVYFHFGPSCFSWHAFSMPFLVDITAHDIARVATATGYLALVNAAGKVVLGCHCDKAAAALFEANLAVRKTVASGRG